MELDYAIRQLREERDSIDTTLNRLERLRGGGTTVINKTIAKKSTTPSAGTAVTANAAAHDAGRKTRKPMSMETRRKISEALRRRHGQAA